MEKVFSKHIKNFFVDVLTAKNGKNYISFTSGRKPEGSTEWVNTRIVIFGENAKEIIEALTEASKHLEDTNEKVTSVSTTNVPV